MKHQFDSRHQALMAVLQHAREAAGLSQRELSVKIGRSRSFIQRIEIGERVLDFLEAIDVAEALGLDVFDLVDRVLSYDKPAPALEPVVVTSKRRAKTKKK